MWALSTSEQNIIKSKTWHKNDLCWLWVRRARLWPRSRVTAQPASFKAQPSSDWSRNGWRAAIGRDEQVDVPIGQ